VGGHVAGLGELTAGGLRMPGQPLPDLVAAGVVVAGEAEIHGGSVFSASGLVHFGPGAGGCRKSGALLGQYRM
jgi:hypothetical protein